MHIINTNLKIAESIVIIFSKLSSDTHQEKTSDKNLRENEYVTFSNILNLV